MLEHEVKARDAMSRAGFDAPIIAFDGRIRRMGKNKSQWCVFYSDGDFSWGAFGDWRASEKHSFCSKSSNEMSNTQRLDYAEKRKRIDKQLAAEKAAKAKEAKRKAARMLDVANHDSHAYIERKQIKQYNKTGVYRGAFVIPVMVNKELSGAQIISGDGTKRFVTGTLKKGGYFPIGDFSAPSTILIAEGYATVASCHEATGEPSVVAFDAGNLPEVAKYVRKSFPNANIIICADNDASGVGLEKANQAATACKGIVRLCPVTSDFNDLHVKQGLQAVRDCIFPPIPKTKPAPVTEHEYIAPKSNQMPFKILGRHAKKCYYMLADGQIYDFSPASHNKQVLIALAPYDFWADAYPSDRGGIATDEAVSWLLRQSERMGFNAQSVRGRGAWIDAGRIIVHQGDDIYDVGENQEYSTDDFNTEYLYPRASSIAAKKIKPLSDGEAQKILTIFQHIPTENALQSSLLAGWIVCSQLSGILEWRPHIWMTGSKSTGKSWVVSKIMKPLMGRNVLYVQSATTEAGIRQTLKADTLPVLFDEAEGNSERSRGNIQRVLELARQASSSEGGVIAKGTTGGDAMDFLIRSCFCFSSIIDGVVQNSDKSRITAIEINKKRYGSDAQYAALVEAKKILTPEICAAFYWRIVNMAETIKHNAGVFADVVGAVVNDSRAGEQLGAMLAGYVALCHGEKMTEQAAHNWVKSIHYLSDYALQYAEQDDAGACVDAIMSYHIEHGDRKANIGDLCERALKCSPYDDDFKYVNKSLAVYGLRIMDDKRLYIANKNERLKQLLSATPYSVGWDKVISRLDGAVRGANPVSFFTCMQRAVNINIIDRFTD